MKNIALLLLFFTSANLFAQDAEIKESVETFFEGLHTRDTALMKTVCYKNIILESITEHRDQGKLDFEVAEEFYKQVVSIPENLKIEERILSYKIQVDGTMAHVWAPYEFYSNGKLSHTGVNSFQLFKERGVWQIVYIIDTRRAPKT